MQDFIESLAGQIPKSFFRINLQRFQRVFLKKSWQYLRVPARPQSEDSVDVAMAASGPYPAKQRGGEHSQLAWKPSTSDGEGEGHMEEGG